MILAADVGASNTRLGLFESLHGAVHPIEIRKYRNRDFPDVYQVLREFLPPRTSIESACFGVAGPVLNGKAELTNCSWLIETARLKAQVGSAAIFLLNDMEATGYGIASLDSRDLQVLNPAPAQPTATAALIAAGTGLGETVLLWNGSRRVPLPAEAGHADFAPNDQVETDLLCYLRGRFHHVSWDRVLSGPGLLLIYQFLRDTGRATERVEIAEAIRTGDPGASIAAAALQGTCELCSQALDIFVGIYGAETGNLALRSLATGGVYVGGGIAPKIREKLGDGHFLRAFLNKGRMQSLLQTIPVYLVLKEETALFGAASFAAATTPLTSEAAPGV
jgi:glucokinase